MVGLSGRLFKNRVPDDFSNYYFADAIISNYPRDAMLARVFATATCLSVCLSHAGIVPAERKQDREMYTV